MKKSAILLLIISITTTLGFSQDVEELHKIGRNLLYEQKEYRKAIDVFKKILEAPGQNTSLKRKTSSNINIGICYCRLRDYENSYTFFEKALQIVPPDDFRNKAIIYNQLGGLYKDKADYQTAISNFKKAYSYYPFKESLNNIAVTYLDLENTDSALFYHQQSCENVKSTVLFTRRVLFASHYRKVNPTEAYKLIVSLNPVKNSPFLDKYYLLLGRYYLHNNNIEKARRTFFEGYSVSNDIYTKIDLLTELNLYTEALKLTNDLLRSAENYTNRLKVAEKKYVIFNKIIQDELDNNNLEAAFMNTDRSKSIALRASLDITDDLKTVKEVQANLLENELMLSYKILHDSLLLIWEITPNTFDLHKKSIGNDFYENLDDYLLTHSTYYQKIPNKINRFAKSAFNTKKYLLGGLDIKGKDIIIIPEERFYNLSFDALITQMPDTNTQYFYRELDYMVYHNTFRYVYMASLNDKNTRYAAFSSLHIIPEKLTISLKGSRKLHEQIKSITTLLSDTYLKSKYDKLRDKYSIIHFDTHGILNMDSSLYSYMQFGGEPLYVKDIINSKVSNDMLILSACNTGVGSVTKGEGGISFERAFILAGGKTIVTSFWRGLDGSSYKIFPEFYRQLRKSVRPEKAMQLAKINYFKLQEKLDAQPFLWANYCIVGQSSTYTEFKTKRRIVLISVLSVVLVGVVFFAFFYKKPSAKSAI